MPRADYSISVAVLLSVGVALSLCIFVATYYSYFSLHQMHTSGSYLPLAIGVSTFFWLMVWLNYLAFRSQAPLVRFAKAAGFALAGTVVFIFLFLFLLLNTIGS